ncbi:ATP-binding cassette, subfamily B/ATP-binding cassette, subfamily C [Actinobaculum suis]|uniref:ABC transporter ATP-binding protein n=1 Tax=Actinobaculum suis TaxID=1657 RepID=A0A1G6ZQW4_9ACTO|nr:ABC transporter ATP-binding protein [Actinobaculum suis]MDY5153944.1 ABC transporter ATP-binding protein [Actinobaculum suis]SDE04911.1 ATP-binding cassette, subfamily B/ATP-binding cassette, subfamily C [Actinobaculum suis]
MNATHKSSAQASAQASSGNTHAAASGNMHAAAQPTAAEPAAAHPAGQPNTAESAAAQPTPSQQLSTRQLIGWLTGITKPVHGPLLISALCRAVQILADIAMFALAGYAAVAAVVGVVDPETGAGSTATGTGDGSFGFSWWIVAGIAACAVLKALFRYLEQFTGHYVAFRALEILRTYVFSKLWPKAPAVVIRQKSGDILASLTRDVDRIEVFYAHTVAPLAVAYLLTPALIIIGGITCGWKILAGAAICLLVSLCIIPYLGFSSSLRATEKLLGARADLTQHVTDTLYGMDEVLAFARAAERAEEMDEIGGQVSRHARPARFANAQRTGLNTILSAAGTISVLALGAGTVPAPCLAALALAVLRSFELPRSIEEATAALDASLAAARRLYDISQEPAAVTDGPKELGAGTAEFPQATPVSAREAELITGPAIDVENLSFTYAGAPAPVLQDVTLHVPAGGRAVILGRSGSGKSTLLHLLVRYFDPENGQICLDGEPLTQFTLDSLRRNVVEVSQRNQLLAGTIADNLRLGAPQATSAEIWQALEIAGLAAEVREMPQGVDTKVGGQGGHGRPTGYALSGGQVQRLSLARAILMRPRVLLLDEFASSLNPDLEAQIRAQLAEALPGLTIVEVSHRPEAAAGADVVAHMDRGHLCVTAQ